MKINEKASESQHIFILFFYAFVYLLSSVVQAGDLAFKACQSKIANPVYTDCKTINDSQVRFACEEFDRKQSEELNLDKLTHLKTRITQSQKQFHRFQRVTQPADLPDIIGHLDGNTALILDPACGEYRLPFGSGNEAPSHALIGVIRKLNNNSSGQSSFEPIDQEADDGFTDAVLPVIRLSSEFSSDNALYSPQLNDAFRCQIISNVRFLVDSRVDGQMKPESVLDYPTVRYLVLDGVSIERGQAETRFAHAIKLNLSSGASQASIINSRFDKSLVTDALVSAVQSDTRESSCSQALKFAGNIIEGISDASSLIAKDIYQLKISGNKEFTPSQSAPFKINLSKNLSCKHLEGDNNRFLSQHLPEVDVAGSVVDALSYFPREFLLKETGKGDENNFFPKAPHIDDDYLDIQDSGSSGVTAGLVIAESEQARGQPESKSLFAANTKLQAIHTSPDSLQHSDRATGSVTTSQTLFYPLDNEASGVSGVNLMMDDTLNNISVNTRAKALPRHDIEVNEEWYRLRLGGAAALSGLLLFTVGICIGAIYYDYIDFSVITKRFSWMRNTRYEEGVNRIVYKLPDQRAETITVFDHK